MVVIHQYIVVVEDQGTYSAGRKDRRKKRVRPPVGVARR